MLKIIFIVLLIAAALYVISAFVITGITFAYAYRRHTYSGDNAVAGWEYYKDRYKRREIRFQSGENTLRGNIYESRGITSGNGERKPKGLIVFSHGIWSGPEEYLMLITWFVDHGWDVFTYSYTAYNESEGNRAKGLPQSAIDLHAALTYIENDSTLSEMKRVVMGHSWGGYASAAVFNFGHRADAVVCLSGFHDPHGISVDVAESMFGKLGRSYGWCIDIFNKLLFRENASLTASGGINRVNAPVLVIHGKNDGFIKYETASIIAHKNEIANPNVTYMTLDDPAQSDHNNYFNSAESTAYYAELEKAMKGMKKEERIKFLKSADIPKANIPNSKLYEQIQAFMI